MPKLTNDKHERFCQEYLIDLNGAQAAIRAGYAEKSSRSHASELLTKPNIQERVAELQAERAENTKIDAEWLLTRLAEEATANIQDLYDENGNLKSIHDWPEIWCTGLIAGIDTESKGGNTTIDKIKVADRAKRLEMIGKHINVGAFEERTKNKTEFIIVTRDYKNEQPFSKEGDSE